MSIATGLAAARQHIRDTLITITAANGYAVTVRTADGAQNENPLKIPDALLPRAFVYSDEARVRPQITSAVGKATSPAMVDIWFLIGKRAGNGEEHEDYLSAVATAIYAAIPPAGTRVLFADEASTFGLTGGGRAILRIPMTIETVYLLR